MDTSVVFTRQIDIRTIAIKPVFNYQKANKHFSEFEKHYHINSNYEAFKNLEQALLNRPAYNAYLLNKSYLLQRLGYADEALSLYRNMMKSKKTNHAAQTTSVYSKKRQSNNYYPDSDNGNEFLMTKKAPKTRKRRKFMATACLSILLSLSAQVVKSQDIEGYVRNTAGNGLNNMSIEAILQNDTTQRKSTTTDNSGYYQLNDIVTGNNYIPGTADDEIRIFYNDKRVIVNIKSAKNIETGRLIALNGQTIAQSKFMQTGVDEYKAEMTVQGFTGEMVLFTDGIHPAQKIIPAMTPAYATETVSVPANGNPKNNDTKSAQSEFNTFIFRIDDSSETDEYQPLEVTKDVDMVNQNNIDFEMTPWPQFYANLDIDISYSNGDFFYIVLNSFDQTLNYDTITDSFGDVYFDDIPIPGYKNNLMLPDTIDFRIEISQNHYETVIDTFKLTDGYFEKEYDTRIAEHEFLIILDAKDNFGNSLTEVNWAIFEYQDTLFKGKTRAFELDTIKFKLRDTTFHGCLEISKENYYTSRDCKNLTYGENEWQTENILIPNTFQIILNSKYTDNSVFSGMQWSVSKITDPSNPVVESCTDILGVDTAEFESYGDSLQVILSAGMICTDLYEDTIYIYPGENILTSFNTLQGVIVDIKAYGDSILIPSDSVVISNNYTSSEKLILNDSITRFIYYKKHNDVINEMYTVENEYYATKYVYETLENGNKYELNFHFDYDTAGYLWRGIYYGGGYWSVSYNDIILSNNELNFNDTIRLIGRSAWKYAVPIIGSQDSTEYNLKIIPSNNITTQPPYFDLEKTIYVKHEENNFGRDTLIPLEQRQKLFGWVKRLQDKQLTSLMDVIVKSYDGTFTDSIRSTNGQFETKPLPVGVEGEGFEGYIIVKPLGADSTDHLGLYKIPITTKEMSFDDVSDYQAEGDVNYIGREIVIPEKLTRFADSTQTTNFMLTPKELTDPYTGAKLKTNPMHIFYMEGEPIDSERSRYGQWNVWIDPTMNMTDYENFLTHIRTLFGKPFNENRVSEKFLFNDLEPYSLQNDNNKDKLGWNIRPGANSTTPRAPPTVEGLTLNLGGDMSLSLSNITGAMREYIIRTLAINVFPSSIRESLANTSIPFDFPDTANIEDRCYIPLFIDHRAEQVKGSLLERAHNNLGYLRDVKDFYNGQTLEEMYGSKK